MKGVIDVNVPGGFKIGLDLVFVSKIAQIYERRSSLFIKRFFTDNEAAYCLNSSTESRRLERMAGRIAVKEAVMKVLGDGWPYVSWTDIEILHDDSRRPYVKLAGKALKLMNSHNLHGIEVSITHHEQMAAAVAIGIPRPFRVGCRDIES